VALLAPIVAFGVTVLLLRALLAPGVARLLLDHPNHRSLHRSPTPRIGGIGVVAGLVAGCIIAGGPWVPLALAGGLMLLSLFDDLHGLPSGARLLGHVGAALILVLHAGGGPGWLAVLLLVLGIGWMTNLYNFMDGADGLAGGMAVVGFGAYALAAWLADQHAFALACMSVAAAGAGFLLFNFPPARMFLGDAGSIPLGFLAGAFGLTGWLSGMWPLWFPPVLFAPFVADASVTLLRRALRGERVWQAHRSHYYQRQVLMGWSHRRLALLEYTLMLVSAAVALTALQAQPPHRIAALSMLAITYVTIGLAIDLRWRARKEART
jgi:UDP-N-acetylmuramyl pentapeptide phosphotransferase/UDP-N-acetylglucosamine-1-phosphate transferase